jgi:medium-chain acyl-[acyl-carrier-protein] hydrolase
MRLNTSTFSSVAAHAYTVSLSVRSYETTSAGVVSPATVLRYLEHVATLDSAARGFNHTWYETHNSAWVVRDMRLLLWPPPSLADELHLATWLSGYRRVQATREYCVWREPEKRLVARAQGRWAYVDRERGLLTRIPDDLLEAFGVAGHAMPARSKSGAMDQLKIDRNTGFEITLTARSYEADTQQHINNTIYMDWLGDALAHALAATPAATAAPEAATFAPRYYHIQYVHPARPGDRVRITTQARLTGSRRLAVSQEIRDSANDQLIVQCRSEHLLCGG